MKATKKIPAVWKAKNEKGISVWHTYDPREGDAFYSDTKKEAIQIWNSLFDCLTKDEMFFMWIDSSK